MTVNTRAPISTVTCTATVINIKNGIAIVYQKVVEHILSKIGTPPLVRILKVTCAVHKNHSGLVFNRSFGLIQSGVDFCAIGCVEGDNFRVLPIVGIKVISIGIGNLLYLGGSTSLNRIVFDEQFRRLVGVGV